MNKAERLKHRFAIKIMMGMVDISDATKRTKWNRKRFNQIMTEYSEHGWVTAWTVNKGHVVRIHDAFTWYPTDTGHKVGRGVQDTHPRGEAYYVHVNMFSGWDYTTVKSFRTVSIEDFRQIDHPVFIQNEELDHSFQGKRVPYHRNKSYRWAAPDTGDYTSVLYKGMMNDLEREKKEQIIQNMRKAVQEGDIDLMIALGMPTTCGIDTKPTPIWERGYNSG